MKTPSKIYASFFAIAMLAACAGASKEKNFSADLASDDLAPPPMMETVKFSPPTVMDEEAGEFYVEP